MIENWPSFEMSQFFLKKIDFDQKKGNIEVAYKINFKANICVRIFDVIWLDCLSGDNAIFFLTKKTIDLLYSRMQTK